MDIQWILESAISVVFWCVTLVLWAFQLGMIALIVRGVVAIWEKRTVGRTRLVLSVVSVFVVLALLIFLVLQPLAFCNGIEVPEDILRSARGQAGGLYSLRLPLIPLYVYVESYSDTEGLYYYIGYFPIGSVKMSLANHTFNMEKPLVGF